MRLKHLLSGEMTGEDIRETRFFALLLYCAVLLLDMRESRSRAERLEWNTDPVL